MVALGTLAGTVEINVFDASKEGSKAEVRADGSVKAMMRREREDYMAREADEEEMEEPSGSAFLRKRAELKAANSTKTQDEEDEALAPTAGQEDETEHAEGTSDSTEPADVETAGGSTAGNTAGSTDDSSTDSAADNAADRTASIGVDGKASSTAGSSPTDSTPDSASDSSPTDGTSGGGGDTASSPTDRTDDSNGGGTANSPADSTANAGGGMAINSPADSVADSAGGGTAASPADNIANTGGGAADSPADSTADGSSAIPNPADNTADGTGGSTVDSAAESTAASTEDSTAGTGMQEGNSAVPEPAESEAEAGGAGSHEATQQSTERRTQFHRRNRRDASLVSRAEPTRTTSGTTFYFTLVSSNKYCANANAGYKKNVGNYQTKACFEYVLADESCGNYFDFGVVDGACDCVPKSQTDCKEADAENYHVYLVQKGGPEALIEVNDQGMEVQANGEPVQKEPKE